MQQLPSLEIRHSTIANASAPGVDMAAGLLLEAALEQSRADGIYLYRFNHFNHPQAVLELVCSQGRTACANPVQMWAGESTRLWLLSLREPARIDSAAWLNDGLGSLPEFTHNRFQSAIVLPLTAEGTLAGLVTAGRLASPAFAESEAAVLLGLRPPLESLLAMAASHEDNARLRSELQTLTSRLAGRKQIERAKGIIQTRHGWTEEEAYLHLRRLSRKTRKPISEIARRVLAHSTSGSSPEAS
jgi:hypothetical protein